MMSSTYNGPGSLETIQLGTTAALIRYDHQPIDIVRGGVLTKRPDGSMEPAGTPSFLPTQSLFFSGVTRDDSRSVTWQGARTTSTFILIGMPDADFQEGDTFVLWGRKFAIAEVHEDKRWQRKAWCVNYG